MPRKLSKSSTFSSINTTTSSSSPDNNSPPVVVLPRALCDGGPLPRLVVFDLDYTLWPFWVDTHVSGSVKAAAGSGNTACVDRVGEHYSFYADVPGILYALPQLGVRVGVASRTHAPDVARDMLKLLHVRPLSVSIPGQEDGGVVLTKKKNSSSSSSDKARKALDFFDAGLEIYPTSKLKHMEALHKRTGVPYEDVLFFDDESRNRDTESLGLTMCLVRDGVTWGELERGVREWRRRRGYTTPAREGGDSAVGE